MPSDLGHRKAPDSDPLLTIGGYGVAGLIGWWLSPAEALAIFLFFPNFYVARVRRVTRS